MRKAVFFMLVCLMMTALSAACGAAPEKSADSVSLAAETATAAPGTKAPEASDEITEAAEPDTASTDAPSPAATAEGPAMYSSYAHMVSFDPARGLAEFDYFDLLRGDDAVEWLVESEGYTVADAAAAVADFADSEFVEKNANPQLRTIDLADIPVTLMFDPETGDMLEPSSPLTGSLIDLYNLFELDHKLVLDAFFYWIEVSQGDVVAVTQVYWP
jgi:hypothetical protein